MTTPSPFQGAILHAAKTTSDNLLVQACAGSGKTTTLRMLCEQALAPNLRIIALCFNAINAETFQQKLPSYVRASTIHSLGYSIIKQNLSGTRVDKGKFDRLITEKFGFRSARAPELMLVINDLYRLVPMVMYTMTNPEDTKAIKEVIAEYGLDLAQPTLSSSYVGEIVKMMRADRLNVSFDDMIDHVVHYKLKGDPYDVILGDEVQDWNRQQAEFVALMASTTASRHAMDHSISPGLADILSSVMPVKQPEIPVATGARVILVGDRKQSIYGFRGADMRSMDNLRERFKCRELPLSVCYRCGTTIIAEAQKIVGVDFIQPAPNAPAGEVLAGDPKHYASMLDGMGDGDMVICRTNAPLVPGALDLISQGRKAVVRGRDIGANIKSIVQTIAKKEHITGVMELVEPLHKWAEDKIKLLLKDERIKAAEMVEDQHDTILALCEGLDHISDLVSRIDRIFDDNVVGVVFSSVHKAKGLEAETVLLLGPERMPHPMASKSPNPERALEQEMNLKYVAVTRAMKRLILMPLPESRGRSNFQALDKAMADKKAADAARAATHTNTTNQIPDFF